MSKKDSLTLGSKLIGLYCLALGIAAWFKVFPAEFIRAGQLAQTDAIFRVSQWTSLISPVVLMFLGLYLIKDGSYVRDFAFRCDDEAPIEDPRDFFALGVQLYGAYLIVSWISTCLWIIFHLVMVLFASSYSSTETELDGIKTFFLPCLSAIALGICCVFWGKSFTRLAFR